MGNTVLRCGSTPQKPTVKMLLSSIRKQRQPAEEFLHAKSDFVYYILEGKGTWIVEDREVDVRAGDVVVVPSGKRFWFRGRLKQICVTVPAWEEQYEHHIRDLEL